MFSETSYDENDGEIKEESSVVDVDFGIGKLSVSPVPYESSGVRADESSATMATSDVSATDVLLSAFDSIGFAEPRFQRNDIEKDTIRTDGVGSICDANPSGHRTDEGNDTSKFDSSDFVRIAEPSAHGEAEVVEEIDETQKPNHPLIVYTSSRRKSIRNTNTKLSQNNESRKPSRGCRKIAKNNSVVDLDSLKILRRRRSLFSKRARSSGWGLLDNILPAFEEQSGFDPNLRNEKKSRRIRGGQGKRNAIRDHKGQTSVRKSFTPTGHISLKIKIGNQSCGMVNVTENSNASEKIIPVISDTMRIKFAEKLPGDMVLPHESNLEKVKSSDASVFGTHLDVRDSVENSSSTTFSDVHRIVGHEEGDHMRASTENRCSDPGTSPDSEVINSVPETPLIENGLPNMQDCPRMPMQIRNQECFTNSVPDVLSADVSSLSFPQMKPKKGKKKNKQYLLGDCTVENKLARAKAECKISPGNLNLPCKKDKSSSKKKGGENNLVGKNRIDEKGDASGVLSGVESHLAAGNPTSSDLGENGDLHKGSSGPINNLQLSVGGLRDQYVPARNAWVLCDECQKWRRIPATLADQIEETNCGWTCKDNIDKDFADCSIPQEKSNSEINAELEISDASGGEDACEATLKSNQNRPKAVQRSAWSLIKSNLFLHRSRKTQTMDEVMVCHCKPPSDGRMGCGGKCLNRMLNIECVRGTCPCGELCSNQQFQKRNYGKLKWFRCGKKGFGLQSLEDISEGQFLIEYVGEVLDMHAYEARQREYALQGHKHFYFMTLNGSEVIDACAKGNLGRYINHSCDPNCRTEKWMVNGEVCVGLFAIRDIKKGEEVTFDYNYVRVFGAAAKKCVCGSPNCRGYIGGDPTNSEVIVQGDSDDEHAEPIVVCEDREMNADWNDIMSISLHEINESANEPPENRYRTKKIASGQLENITSEAVIQKVDVNSASMDGYFKTSTAAQVVDMMVQDKTSYDKDFASTASVLPLDTSEDNVEYLNSSASGPHESEMTTIALPSKSQPDTTEYKRKLKYGTLGGKEELAKSESRARTHRTSSSIKKGKLKTNIVNEKGTLDADRSNAPQKSKKLSNLSLNSHVEAAVEEKLNELLDTEGGISKRKDASRGYLKLLFLTAATGTNGHGEAIQSNRDLSMILDALLKTKSRTVLVDIINKNGLQMLHNIMKRYRKEFTKTPILRKLLKVLEYLAMREILNLEHITGGPACPGVESFKDSILTLTEHADKQVHQIARNFRDRWIPRSLRKNFFMEMDDRKMEFHQRGYRSSNDHWNDRSGKPAEVTECRDAERVIASGTVETSSLDHSSASGCSSGTNGTRKRKSRWDTPAEENLHSRLRTNMSGDGTPDNDEDIPPGFSPHGKDSVVKVNAASTAFNLQGRDKCTKLPFDIVLGVSQQRFIASMPVSYGVPSSVIQQFGVLKAEAAECWTVAPGLPFYPFPPLPPCARNKGDPLTSSAKCASFSELAEKSEQGNGTCVAHHSGQKRPMPCSMDPPEMSISVANERPDFQREGGSYSLGKKYFRQQKWNNSKLGPPWVRMRNGWGNAGNTRNGMPGIGLGDGANQIRNSYISESEGFNWRGEC